MIYSKKLILAAVLSVISIGAVAIGLIGHSASASTELNVDNKGFTPLVAGVYKIDPAHSYVGFGITHFGINTVKGRFKEVAAEISFNDKDLSKSSVTFSAKIDSVDTGVAARDRHLKTADFFDMASFPEMTFKSTKVEKKGKSYMMTGDLTIRGTTKSISFPFTMTEGMKDSRGGTRFGIAANTTINRRDFGVNYGGPMPSGILDVANDVDIELHLEGIPAAPAPAAK